MTEISRASSQRERATAIQNQQRLELESWRRRREFHFEVAPDSAESCLKCKLDNAPAVDPLETIIARIESEGM